jgi:hypothetical protein
MNLRRVHQAAALTSALYKIAYTTMLLAYLFRRKQHEPMPPGPSGERRRYH